MTMLNDGAVIWIRIFYFEKFYNYLYVLECFVRFDCKKGVKMKNAMDDLYLFIESNKRR